MIRQPKGTLHSRIFRKNELVTATTYSKKHGFLYLIGAQLLGSERVLACYGRLKA